MKHSFIGTIQAPYKIIWENPKAVLFYLLMYDKKEVTVTIDDGKISKKRSLPENNYYWGCIVTPLAEYMGYTVPKNLHYDLRKLFLFEIKEFKTAKGETKRRREVKSTTELSTQEAEEYYAKIRQWALTDYDFFIPLPNESMDMRI